MMATPEAWRLEGALQTLLAKGKATMTEGLCLWAQTGRCLGTNASRHEKRVYPSSCVVHGSP